MHRITRSHEIDAGHRVFGHESKCARIHGHRYGFYFTCAARTLDPIGRVIDFSVIKQKLCFWLEENWDHRLLLWNEDPLLQVIYDFDPGSVVALPCNPTAENLAQLMVNDVGPEQLEGTGVTLISCTVHETAKCSATYSDESLMIGHRL